MWQQTQSEKREQLFPPGSAWKKALTPPQRETKAKKAEANHLLRMQVGLCVLLVGAVLLLRQLNKPVYEEFRREYAALTQQEGADGERLLQFAGSLAAGVQKKARVFSGKRFGKHGRTRRLPCAGLGQHPPCSGIRKNKDGAGGQQPGGTSGGISTHCAADGCMAGQLCVRVAKIALCTKENQRVSHGRGFGNRGRRTGCGCRGWNGGGGAAQPKLWQLRQAPAW